MVITLSIILGTLLGIIITSPFFFILKRKYKGDITKIKTDIEQHCYRKIGLYTVKFSAADKPKDVNGKYPSFDMVMEVEQISESNGMSKIKILNKYTNPSSYHDYSHGADKYNNTWVENINVKWLDEMNIQIERDNKLKTLLSNETR